MNKKTKNPPSRAERNISWIEKYCIIPKGPSKGGVLLLTSFQKRMLRNLYSPVNPVIRRAIWSMARKNAKTSLGAAILLLHMSGPEAKPGTNCVSTAHSKEQASILWDVAQAMRGPELTNVIEVRQDKSMLVREIDVRYKALTSEHKTNLGLVAVNLHFADELGEVQGPESDLFSAVEDGMVDTDDPLSVIISTQAADDADLLSILIDQQLSNPRADTVLELHTTKKGSRWELVSSVKEANPGYPQIVRPAAVKDAIRTVKDRPSAENNFRRYRLNQRITTGEIFIPLELWRACAGEIDMDAFEKGPTYGGLDLGETSDLTALAWVCRRSDGKFQCLVEFFMPDYDIEGRTRRENIPYSTWKRAGLVTCTPGKITDFEVVAARSSATIE